MSEAIESTPVVMPMALEGRAMRFEGRVAAVTGGGAGIGAAICRRLAEEGAVVAALDLALDAAEELISELPQGAAIRADVSDSDSVEEALSRVETDLGPLAIMVNNAGALALEHVRRVTPLVERQQAELASTGVAETPLDALIRLTDEEWRFVMSVHLDGTFYGTRAAVRRMAPRGTGTIINMASVCGIEGCIGHPHYSAAKAGVLGFTRSTAKEVIVQGIRVNAVAPGFIDTTRQKTAVGAARQINVARTPAGRLGTPDEVAAAVAFLASDDAAFFVGATVSPNGGLVTAV
jgi:NAD(P)-dependent dehydrogenase (short-subunit alcohol dehydrogenase family)